MLPKMLTGGHRGVLSALALWAVGGLD
jgi:hypothetical protein